MLAMDGNPQNGIETVKIKIYLHMKFKKHSIIQGTTSIMSNLVILFTNENSPAVSKEKLWYQGGAPPHYASDDRSYPGSVAGVHCRSRRTEISTYQGSYATVFLAEIFAID